jgi:hypothetical protein
MLNITVPCLDNSGSGIMKTLKTSSSNRRVVVVVIVALLAATTIIVTVVGMAVVVPASSIVKPAYAQLDDISEQIIAEEEIPSELDIREKVEEVTSQSVPRPAELGIILLPVRSPPAFAD